MVSVASKDQNVGRLRSDLVATMMTAALVPAAKAGTWTVPLDTTMLLIEASPLPAACTLTDWLTGAPAGCSEMALQVGAEASTTLVGGGEAVVAVVVAGAVVAGAVAVLVV